MKKFDFYSTLLLMFTLFLLVSACGGDDAGGNNGGSNGSNLINQAVGIWMCVESTDAQSGTTMSNLMVGKEVEIKNDGTYTSTASSFG